MRVLGEAQYKEFVFFARVFSFTAESIRKKEAFVKLKMSQFLAAFFSRLMGDCADAHIDSPFEEAPPLTSHSHAWTADFCRESTPLHTDGGWGSPLIRRHAEYVRPNCLRVTSFGGAPTEQIQ
jgi:hypothetical protein